MSSSGTFTEPLPSSGLQAESHAALHQQLPPIAAAIRSVRILVIGDVMLDRYWFGDVSRISPEAPVPIVQVTRSDDRLGGAANVARNVAALGAGVSLIGAVGQDEAGERLSQLLLRDGVHAQLQVRSSCATIIKLRVLSRQQQMLRIDFDSPQPGLRLELSPASLQSLMQQHDAVVLSDYAKGGLINAQPWIAMARELELPVLVDPKSVDFSRYAGASVLKPNASEFRLAAGTWSDEQELQQLAQQQRKTLGVEALLVTRSELGMSLFDGEGACHFPAQVREVFDVSGAGDTVIAAMATLLAAGADMRFAVAIANRAAGLAISRLGTTAVTMNELMSSLH